MKRNLIKTSLMAMALVTVLLLQACAPAAQAPAPVQETPVAETPVQDTPAADPPVADPPAPAPADGGTDTIVLYSNAVSDGRGEWIQERAKAELGIEVQLVDLGGVALANRLIAERYNPMGDVIFGLNPILWMNMEDNEIIVPHVPPWAAEVPAHLHNKNSLFHAVILVGNLLTYSKAELDPADAPGDWLELWENTEFHGRYVLPQALTGSTIQMILSGIISRFLDPNGHLGVSEEGWRHIEAMFKNGVPTEQDIYAEITSNPDVQLGQMWSHGVPVREKQYNIEIGYVVPPVGVPFSIEGVALINGAKNPEAAKRFIDWFGTAEVMHDFSATFGFLPAHPAALEGLGGMTAEMAEVPQQQIDWATVAYHMSDWLEHIYLSYMQ